MSETEIFRPEFSAHWDRLLSAMHHLIVPTLCALFLGACATTKPAPLASTARDPAPEGTAEEKPADGNEFQLRDSKTAKDARGVNPSKIEPTATEAAVRFIVVDKDKGPVQGLVIKLSGAKGTSYYAEETDAKGYTELLLPVGQSYDLVYLSLGRRDVKAKVEVTDEPNQNIKLTLIYKSHRPKSSAAPGFVLKGIQFDTDKATIRPKSFPRLDQVLEFMEHKKSARIEISGHTDTEGNPKANKVLSRKRAQACRDYLVSKGIDASRIRTVGHGQDQPIASNDTAEGRQKNRRIEAKEL